MKAKEKSPTTKKAAVSKKTTHTTRAAHKTVATKKPLSALSEKLAQMPSARLEGTVDMPQASAKRPPTFLVLAWVAVLALALFYFRGQFIVATVNGQPIFRSALVRELERQSGKQVLDNIVLKTVVMQEAAKQKVTVTPKEVDDEIKKLEETFKNRGQDLETALTAQGMTQADLKEQMMLQKLVEKMVSKDVTVSDDEVAEYMEKNKAFLPKDAKPDQLKTDLKAQLLQQKQTAKIQEWVTALKDKAKISHWLFK